MKPLLMMRTKGVTGPFVAKHQCVPKLSKSAGNAVSAGVSSIIVPDVVGLGDTAASATIVSAGLVAAKIGTVDPVISQEPEAGTNVALGSTVTFTLTS